MQQRDFWVALSARSPDNFALLCFQAASKYNSQYHKLFKDIPTEESVLKGGWQGEGWAWRQQDPAQGLPWLSLCLAVCSCALQRDILIQGRLYISPNWLCFYANLFGKDIKVMWAPAHPGPSGLVTAAYPLLHPNTTKTPNRSLQWEGEHGHATPSDDLWHRPGETKYWFGLKFPDAKPPSSHNGI